MIKLIFKGIFLVTVLNTVCLYKTVTKERMMNSNYTENKKYSTKNMNSYYTKNNYETSTIRFLEEDDLRVDSQTNIMWLRYLAAKRYAIKQKVKKRWTTPMANKPNYVTESIPVLIETKENSNSKVTSSTDTQAFEYEDDILLHRRADDSGPFARGQSKQPSFQGFRSPYWKDGHLVFFGPTQTTKRGVTEGDEARMLNYDDCTPSCIYYFKAYGKVCGHRFNTKTWLNEYQNFTDLCEMDLWNCRNKTKRPHWHPMYRGPCFVDPGYREFPHLWLNPTEILKHQSDYAPYKYVPPTASLVPTVTTQALNLNEFLTTKKKT